MRDGCDIAQLSQHSGSQSLLTSNQPTTNPPASAAHRSSLSALLSCLTNNEPQNMTVEAVPQHTPPLLLPPPPPGPPFRMPCGSLFASSLHSSLQNMTVKQFRNTMAVDKKVQDGKLRLILLK